MLVLKFGKSLKCWRDDILDKWECPRGGAEGLTSSSSSWRRWLDTWLAFSSWFPTGACVLVNEQPANKNNHLQVMRVRLLKTGEVTQKSLPIWQKKYWDFFSLDRWGGGQPNDSKTRWLPASSLSSVALPFWVTIIFHLFGLWPKIIGWAQMVRRWIPLSSSWNTPHINDHLSFYVCISVCLFSFFLSLSLSLSLSPKGFFLTFLHKDWEDATNLAHQSVLVVSYVLHLSV